MTLRRRLTVGLAWMFAGNWAEQACNFVVFVILARLLGADAIGLAMMAIVFVVFSEFLVRETITEVLIQRKDVTPGHLDAVFWSLAGVSLALIACLFVLSEPLAAIYGEPQVADFLRWATPTILFIGLSGVPVALLRRKLEFGMLAVRATVGVVLGGIVGVTMAIMDYGAWSLIGQRLVQVFVNSILAWLANPWRPGFRSSRQDFRDVWGFGVQMLGLRAAEIVSIQTPTVVIGSFLGAAALGYFTIAWRIVEVLSFVLTTPVRFVSQSTFAQLQHNLSQAGDLLREITEASSLIAAASFLGLAMVATPSMVVLFGTDWQPAAPVLQVLCLAGVYLSIERLQQSLCLAMGYPGPLFVLSIAEAVLGIAIMLFVARYGAIYVTIAFVARYYALWPFRFYIVRNVVGINLRSYIVALALPILLASIMAGVVFGWQYLIADTFTPFVQLLSSVLIGLAVYAGAVALAMPDRIRRLVDLLKGVRRDARISTANNESATP